jgi:tetratricopeptide (TPR) repeat protein
MSQSASGTLFEEVEDLKSRGNEAFKAGDTRTAIVTYTLCIEKSENDPNRSIPQTLLSLLYANRAAAFISIGKNEEARHDSFESLKHDSSNMKAYYRAAKSCLSLGLLTEAIDVCNQALRVEPNHRELLDILRTCQSRIHPGQERGFTQEDALNCQTSLRELEDQETMLKQKIRAGEIEIARLSRTQTVLDEFGDSKCYKALGRGFVLSDQSDIRSDIAVKIQAIGGELDEIRKTSGMVEQRRINCEKEMKEIIAFFNRKQSVTN